MAVASFALVSIRIRNLALVEELEWQLAPGFTVITGETGSGKSIIVGALKLILGERADKTLIRSGADSCSVEAVFHVTSSKQVNEWFSEQGVEPCEDGQMIVKRVFSGTGTNRQFINGSPTTLAVLKELGDGLVDLHGPHDHQSLLSTEKQLALLDAFADSEETCAGYAKLYREVNRLIATREELMNNEAALERELDLLRHQVSEIQDAAIASGEEEELLSRYTLASNSRRLLELSSAVLDRISESEDAATNRIAESVKLLRDLERIDPGASRFSDSLHRATAELDELISGLQRYVDDLEVEPGALAEMEKRVSLFETLKRKYGGTISEVVAFGEQAAARLQTIESRGEEVERLGREIEQTRKAMMKVADELSAKRKKAAPKLAKSIAVHLTDLGFKKSDFEVALAALPAPASGGLESVEFVFAPNPGEPAKPLKAIASSGEISRVMLAVKSALASQDTVGLLVFDEIDANVGGEIAHAVGAKMRAIAKERQVIAISHLPQVAAAGQAQFVVSKDITSGRTISQLTEVKGKARVEEIARMLGGKTDSALVHAGELLTAK